MSSESESNLVGKNSKINCSDDGFRYIVWKSRPTPEMLRGVWIICSFYLQRTY